MNHSLLILIAEALVVYCLVLWVHAQRHRFGTAHFYALIGGLTAVMSWVTDAGMKVVAGGLTFYVGSTVFYTAILLGVFVIYVFDGPRTTRIIISTVVGVSAIVPLIAATLHLQSTLLYGVPLAGIPIPSLRINAASVLATLFDLVFLAMAWEFFGKPALQIRLGLRTFLTLLGVMLLDVVLFATGAFAGSPDYLGIMQGTLSSRCIISTFAFPLLYLYIHFEGRRQDVEFENRPVLAILRDIARISTELDRANEEIRRRKSAEEALQKALSEVKVLRGLIPICAACKSIRNDKGYWEQIEVYVHDHSEAEFSHGICPDCLKKLYPDYEEDDARPPA